MNVKIKGEVKINLSTISEYLYFVTPHLCTLPSHFLDSNPDVSLCRFALTSCGKFAALVLPLLKGILGNIGNQYSRWGNGVQGRDGDSEQTNWLPSWRRWRMKWRQVKGVQESVFVRRSFCPTVRAAGFIHTTKSLFVCFFLFKS